MNTCYERSCWCAPVRCIAKCFGCRKTEVRVLPQSRAHRVQLSIASVNQIEPRVPPTPLSMHVKNRSWVILHGKMDYREDSEVKS